MDGQMAGSLAWERNSDEELFLRQFARDVSAGLSAQPKHLPCRYFYDREGSLLFEEICQLEEYYLTRAEREILTRHAGEIAGHCPGKISVVELGSGSSVKTGILLSALLKQGEVRYFPIDVSRTMLAEAANRLVSEFPALKVEPVADEYEPGLARVVRQAAGRKLVAWLGSSIGNLDRSEALAFLRRTRQVLGQGDRVLVGIDLRKQRRMLERAYSDSRQVTARFNLNLLARINRELGGQFDLAAFRHLARYSEEEGKVDMYLESTKSQVVRVAALNREFPFAHRERIHTESSYKYSVEEIDALVRGANLELLEQWFDPDRLFSLSLLQPSFN
jgi:dimethylhistidine N-methyltransferase